MSAGPLVPPAYNDLAALIERITPGQAHLPTPCSEFDVTGLVRHIASVATLFGVVFNDPEATRERPGLETVAVPEDPAQAADLVRAAADRIDEAVADGVAGVPTTMLGSPMPGETFLSMAVWEVVVHGDDLAKAIGAPWDPPAVAVEKALAFAPSMLTGQYRGPGMSFAAEVPVPDDAPTLDRLLGFSGRDPGWRPPATA